MMGPRALLKALGSRATGLFQGQVWGVVTWKVVLDNLMSLTLGAGISQALMALSVLLVARQLGSARFGEYAASFSTAGLASILFNLGLDTWLLQSDASDPDRLRERLGNALAIKLCIGLPWIGALVAVLPHWNPETFHPQLVFAGAACMWMEGVLGLVLSTFRTLLRNQVTASFMVGSRGAVLLLTLLFIAFGVQDVMVYAGLRLAVSLATAGVGWTLLPVRPRMGAPSSLVRSGQQSLPFALSDLLTSVYVQADTTIAAIALNREAVGIYSPASSFVNALFVVPSAWYYVTVPVLVRTLKVRASFHKAIGPILGSYAVLGLLMWLGVWYVSRTLPGLVLGSSFEQSGPVLAILSPILLLKSCSFGAAAILVAVGWQTRRTGVQAVSAVVNVALNLLLIQRFGLAGVAGVYVVSEIVLMIGYVGFVAGWAYRSRRSLTSQP